jgi:hypothetical protein
LARVRKHYAQCRAAFAALKIGSSLVDEHRSMFEQGCRPDHINSMETASGTRDQYVFENLGNLYFENGRLVAKQY